MALSKPRKLKVGDKMYHWKVSSHGRLHFAIFDTHTEKRLAVWFEKGDIITPAVIRKAIEQAKEGDWK